MVRSKQTLLNNTNLNKPMNHIGLNLAKIKLKLTHTHLPFTGKDWFMHNKHSSALHFAHRSNRHIQQSPKIVKQLPIKQLLLFSGRKMLTFDPKPCVDNSLQLSPLQFDPQRHFPPMHIPFALHYFGHLFTAQTYWKFKGHVKVPSNPLIVMVCPGKRQNPNVFPILIVKVFIVGEQITSQHLNGCLEAAAPVSLRSESKHLESFPPFYPVLLMIAALTVLVSQLGSMQRQLMQYFMQRQSERESFLQNPTAVLSQSHLFTSICLQYSFEVQLVVQRIEHPLRYPKFMKLPYVLQILRYQPVSYNNAKVMQETVGLLGETPAVMSQFMAVFLDQWESAVPVPPLPSRSIPGGFLHPYCLQTSALMKGPVMYDPLSITLIVAVLKNEQRS